MGRSQSDWAPCEGYSDGQRKIIGIIGTAVLPGHNVFDVVQQFAVSLVKPAILASLSGPLTDEPPGSGIPH